MKSIKAKLQKDVSNIKSEVKKKVVGYILAAFGLVAGLAWNDAIKSLIEMLFPQNQNSVVAKIVYAAAITMAIVVISIYLSKITAQDEEEKKVETADKKEGAATGGK